MTSRTIRNAALALIALGLSNASALDADVGSTTSRGPQSPPTAQTGDAKRGAALYDTTYRCYACHGYKGESGLPRLVPMARSLESFISYVRKPATAQMPRFVDVPAPDLVDIHAYLRSVKPESPAAESVPLLQRLLQRVVGRPGASGGPGA